jgi:hypothetical protein
MRGGFLVLEDDNAEFASDERERDWVKMSPVVMTSTGFEVLLAVGRSLIAEKWSAVGSPKV